MRQRTERDEAPGQDGHRTSTVERGAFSHARCTCGWIGPARRAREVSRADAEAHGGRAEGGEGERVADDDSAGEEGVRGSL
ncbi:hypothetical protein G4Z16_18210 [Streptomyces bathyalis]|uniref:Uncharacterized protein n=1 Tax=Streptomyces bathyalis TaxID=2710756 RepID=A0A7T1T267_9ACTN|nr:hypothetical protein [Streptomyces bathyalis]QPP05024.1 hypothetical protein G4Z16_18210 [Streptomyces bathyalis]